MAIGTGITCDLVQIIDREECIGNSLPVINTNFTGIDTGLCELTSYADYLTTLVDTLSTRLALAVKQLVPVGTIQPFSYLNGNTGNTHSVLPFGWYPCEGQIIPIYGHIHLTRVLYVGNSNNSDVNFEFGYKCKADGTRDISGLFIKLPDLRGYFVRSHGTNTDGIKSDKFGKRIADAFQGHYHNTVDPSHAHTYTDPGHDHRYMIYSSLSWGGGVGGTGWWIGDGGRENTEKAKTDITIDNAVTNLKITEATTGLHGTARVDKETRPRSMALQFGIKWFSDMI